MTDHPNIFACLVHENQDCVIDLVRNLRRLDPDSQILLYNGGHDQRLLNSGFPFERYGAIVHPRPQPVPWGKLHPFALDCMQFALDHFPFQTLTVVDSDQLAVRSGFSNHLAAFLHGRSGVGVLSNAPICQGPNTSVSPAQNAHREIDLWRPLLRRYPDGEKKFVHWSFWPSTVFTAEAARDLTQLFATDSMLQDIMARTRIWATEEIILPTLVALLGYQIVAGPYSYNYVQYRKQYTLQQVKAALVRSDVFWVHPIPRSYENPLRNHLRASFGNYEENSNMPEVPMSELTARPVPGLLLTWPILNRMKQIEGWLEEDEADLLIAATALALNSVPDAQALVEVGSYCGRSTHVVGSVLKALRPSARLYAIDPNDGRLGALDLGIKVMPPPLEKLRHNLNTSGLTEHVEITTAHSWETAWDKPTSLVLIDGLHDYASVARDFYHFEPHLVPGGYAAFHDYADYYPGVKTFVNELLRTARYEIVHRAGTMILLRKSAQSEPAMALQFAPCPPAQPASGESSAEPSGAPPARVEVLTGPLVSCIMPTADRRSFALQAIQYFLRQDYPNRELIILDDGADSIADLIPPTPAFRYVRMHERKTMGAKHNLACEMAKGEIIVHWDDDDWMADRRVSYQVSELIKHPPQTLCGLSHLIYYEPSTDRGWRYIYQQNGRPWVCGNSFCYRKQFWENYRFPEKNEGADTSWVWGLRGKKVVALPDPTFFVAIMHPRNTSPKRPHSPPWHPCSTQEIRDLMQKDWAYYRSAPGLA